ncbi:MAG: hypothetical protein AB7S44_03800 [Spirochaetales bacterium]
MELLLFATAGVESGIGFLSKKYIMRGMDYKEYFYYVTVALLPLSLIMFLFYPFYISISFLSVSIIMASVMVRFIGSVSYTLAVKKTSPLEISAYSTFAILITYFVDSFIGSVSFNIWALVSLFIIILGCILIAREQLDFKNVEGALFVKIVTDVLKGYLTYFALKEMSSAMYIFLMAFISVLIMVPFTKKFITFNFNKLKQGTYLQLLGIMDLALLNLLASNSATLYMLRVPAVMVTTFLLSFFIKKDVGNKPDKLEFLGSMVVFTGLTIFTILQF